MTYKPNCLPGFEGSREDENIAGALYDSFGKPFDAGNQVHRKKCVHLIAEEIRKTIKYAQIDFGEYLISQGENVIGETSVERIVSANKIRQLAKELEEKP